CADCHNPHASQSDTVAATPPASQPSLTGAFGVSGTDGFTPLRQQETRAWARTPPLARMLA
ncbi:MAG: hypothetical protein M1451_04910, partial [Acidobacteria bacterium]|nr:hypothetical protein [Acidobacteriota bacterium]